MTQVFEHLDHATLESWLDAGQALTLVDIRDPLSYSRGHIPGSRHLDNASIGELFDQAPREQPLVVVCYHGHSSQQAASWLAGEGFQQVYSLDGGFTDWEVRHPQRVAK